MKKRLAAFILAVVMLMIFAAHAGAVSATFNVTKSIIDAFDRYGYKYTLVGLVNGDKDEKISISFNGDNKDEISLSIIGNDSSERVQIFSYNVIRYSDADFDKVLRAVNELNYNWVYVKFYCDETDKTVTAEFDAYTPAVNAGDITVSMVKSFVEIVDKSYATLAGYDQ